MSIIAPYWWWQVMTRGAPILSATNARFSPARPQTAGQGGWVMRQTGIRFGAPAGVVALRFAARTLIVRARSSPRPAARRHSPETTRRVVRLHRYASLRETRPPLPARRAL